MSIAGYCITIPASSDYTVICTITGMYPKESFGNTPQQDAMTQYKSRSETTGRLVSRITVSSVKKKDEFVLQLLDETITRTDVPHCD